MGSGSYSHLAHQALTDARAGASVESVFRQSQVHPTMAPFGVKVRECRDSAQHPAALGIAFALDVTGSMGEIPRLLATEQLPKFMKTLMDCHVADPQVLFMAVGDAWSDLGPLQVGQYESTAELMDQWLTRAWIERGGGGNGRESYDLAMYFVAQHTELDAVVNRGQHGYLFLTGDELPYDVVSRHDVQRVIGDVLDEDVPIEALVAELARTTHTFFLIPDPSRVARIESRWRELLGDRVLCLDTPADVCWVSAGALLLTERKADSLDALMAQLQAAGMEAARVGPVRRALHPYAASLLGPAPTTAGGAPGVLKRLFGLGS